MSSSNNDKPKIVQEPDEPFTFLGELNDDGSREPIQLDAAIGQAIGAASMCWTIRPHGIFMDARAVEIMRALTHEIDRRIDEAYQEGFNDGAGAA